jgi:16S rRNA (cytidine1402-2'-O)-methyltransferase
MEGQGSLYMIPTVIAEETQDAVIPSQTIIALKELRHFLVEDVRTARRFLSSLHIYKTIEELNFFVLNKDTSEPEIATLMAPLLEGINMGVLSESGCPGVADPGALAVDYAHRKKIKVLPLVGPSSILLALMGSGLNGQQFVFNGYLPIESAVAAKAIIEMEKESKTKRRTQIFIETPYRNNTLFRNLISNLHNETKVCVALDLTSPHEEITTLPVREWKQRSVSFPKRPAIFLFLA